MRSDKDICEFMDSDAWRKLLGRKFRMSLYLSGLMLLVYSLYFIAIAWFPGWMGSTPGEQGIISNGIWFTVFCVIFSVLISAFYIWWANNYYDGQLQAMLGDQDRAGTVND